MTGKESLAVLTLYAALALVGGMGGAAVGAHLLLSSRRGMWLPILLSYIVIGATVAFGVGSYLLWSNGAVVAGMPEADVHQLLMAAAISGALGAASLGSMHLIAKAVLRWHGIEVQVTMRKEDRDE